MTHIIPTITIVKSKFVVTNATHSVTVDADTMREAVVAARRTGIVGSVTVKPNEV